jgi:hypothetical protein
MALKGRYRLIIKQGPVPGKVFEIAKQVITIGRDVKSDFVVNDAEVSRTHVRLTIQAEGCLAEDLSSTNGAFINGQRITNPRVLRPGDVLGLGETVLIDFVFVPDSEATVIAPPMDWTPRPGEMPVPSSGSGAGVRPAPSPRVELSTAQAGGLGTAPLAEKRDSRVMWGLGIGCGVLLLLACLVLVVVALVLALNPSLLPSLRGG